MVGDTGTTAFTVLQVKACGEHADRTSVGHGGDLYNARTKYSTSIYT